LRARHAACRSAWIAAYTECSESMVAGSTTKRMERAVLTERSCGVLATTSDCRAVWLLQGRSNGVVIGEPEWERP
jgi:hypothetical protein